VIINKGKIVADSEVSQLNNLNQEQVITVAEFESPIEVNLLQQIPGIQEVEQVANFTYRLKARKNADIRSAVFALAAEHKWSLIGLRQEEQSLEKIFQSLTK
ncbi:MAG: gliding motility-associated ABC transporter ATP-binding subunit GldA, partial [Bacteroidota bacterium]|nr:gliding motility-associated ABC transporter ATP-binding subunit GldA [Bacteroidota bacterium]